MNQETYLALDFQDLSLDLRLDRRQFLKLTGGGILILFTLPGSFAFGQGRQYPNDFNAYLRIGEDGRVTCFTGKIEMGQGIITSLAQMLAEELDVPMESVAMVMGDTDLCPWDMGTFGSMTTRFFGPALRTAGAEARQVLLELAAESLQVPVNQLTVRDGVISHKSNPQQHVSYAQLAQGKAITRKITGSATVQKVEDFTVIGQPVLRRDALAKVTGQAQYAGDIRLPGMLYARIVRPPSHDAKLLTVDTVAAQAVQDAQVVRDGDFIAVLHPSPDGAERALALIQAQFETPPATVDDKTIFDHLLKVAPSGDVVAHGGTLAQGATLSAATVESTYLNSYVAHAPIEPHTAVAQVEGDRITVWASTQTPFGLKDQVARALRISVDQVRVITPFVGGGFGGKTSNQQGVEAARLAKLTGKPVQVAWTRAEEFFYDTFRPAAIVTIRSGVAADGKLVLWDYHVYFAGERGSQQFYAIPHHSTAVHGSGWRGIPGSHPFATGAWRAPSNNTNTFARESQIDVMAAKAGIDPLEFRLRNLTDARMKNVLQLAADKFGWQPAKSPSGRGVGIACSTDAGTYVVTIAEVAVDKTTGQVQVQRIVCAQDMGQVINPAGAEIQMEGCLTMGLGYALTEEVHFQGGQIKDLNFDTYEIPRFSWVPKIETVILDNQHAPAQGGGEPAITGIGAVLANAIYDAIGVRLWQLPMTPQRIKAALA